MKNRSLLIVAIILVVGMVYLVGCEADGNNDVAPSNSNNNVDAEYINPENKEGYVDARYRGIYDDRGENQVTVQFYLEDDYFEDLSFRQLEYDDIDYENPEDIPEDYVFDEETILGMGEQYQAAIDYLEGAHVSTLSELHEPGELGLDPDEVDGMTAATIRSSKIVSAIRDALNRGAYDNITE